MDAKHWECHLLCNKLSVYYYKRRRTMKYNQFFTALRSNLDALFFDYDWSMVEIRITHLISVICTLSLANVR